MLSARKTKNTWMWYITSISSESNPSALVSLQKEATSYPIQILKLPKLAAFGQLRWFYSKLTLKCAFSCVSCAYWWVWRPQCHTSGELLNVEQLAEEKSFGFWLSSLSSKKTWLLNLPQTRSSSRPGLWKWLIHSAQTYWVPERTIMDNIFSHSEYYLWL